MTRKRLYLDPRATSRSGHRGTPQTLECNPAVPISKGCFVGLYNPAGRLFLQTESRGVQEHVYFSREEEDQATGELSLRCSTESIGLNPNLFHPPPTPQRHSLHPDHPLHWSSNSTRRCHFETESNGCPPATGLVAGFNKIFGAAGRMESRKSQFALCFSCFRSSHSRCSANVINVSVPAVSFASAEHDRGLESCRAHETLIQNRERSRPEPEERCVVDAYCSKPSSYPQILVLVAFGASFVSSIDWRGHATDDMVLLSTGCIRHA